MGFVQRNNDMALIETAALRKRVIKNVSKVGKGSSKDTKAHRLVQKYWLEAIDPTHRYGNNLEPYFKKWSESSTDQNFFSWLDSGDGIEVDLEECPRSKLDEERVKYLEPEERDDYEYAVVDGKILHKKTQIPLHHEPSSHKSDAIFVVSTSKKLYIGEKKKGFFHHSSFLAGGAILTAGRLLVEDGILQRISPSSGHYHPTKDSLERFLSILKENEVNHVIEFRSESIKNISRV